MFSLSQWPTGQASGTVCACVQARGCEGAGDKGPGVRFRAQLNCPELSFFVFKEMHNPRTTHGPGGPAKQAWNVLPFPLVIVFSS